jgi:hypothetical protein
LAGEDEEASLREFALTRKGNLVKPLSPFRNADEGKECHRTELANTVERGWSKEEIMTAYR